MKNLTVDVINKLIGVNESYKASDKLMSIMFNREERDKVFRSFLEIEKDLSFDWLTEYFQAEHSDRKGKKQDFTPDGIIQVASGVLGSTDSNADICAGTGGLTIKRYSENKGATVYCEEFSDRAMPFLLFNLAIRNVDAIVCHGDSLTREFKAIYQLSKSSEFSEIKIINELPNIKNQTVIMNPPYSMPWDAKKERLDEDRFKDYGALAPKSKSDYAFLLQGLHSLEENGTMSVILPHGVLFRGSSEEKIRTKLIELNYLDAVIGLPVKAFITTDIPTVLLVFKKNRQNTDVLFIDASKECVKRGPNNVLEGQHVEKILETFKNRNNIEKFSKKIAFSEIEENGFNLNIPRYIDTFEPEEIIPLGETLAELKQIDSEIMVAELNLASMLDELVSNNVAGQKEIDEMADYFYSKNNVFSKNKNVRGS